MKPAGLVGALPMMLGWLYRIVGAASARPSLRMIRLSWRNETLLLLFLLRIRASALPPVFFQPLLDEPLIVVQSVASGSCS